MNVVYNDFAKSFAASRKNMKWEEIVYFFSNYPLWDKILDIWCGSGRFLEQYSDFFWKYPEKYMWIDLSQWLLEEAKLQFPEQHFLQWNMSEVDKLIWKQKFDSIFLIASFHHLRNYPERKEILKKLSQILSENGCIFMTNWALDSQKNQLKYSDSKILGSENKFGSNDYNVKFSENPRYYHSFSIEELVTLFSETWYTILENRIFENDKNIISILKK